LVKYDYDLKIVVCKHAVQNFITKKRSLCTGPQNFVILACVILTPHNSVTDGHAHKRFYDS